MNRGIYIHIPYCIKKCPYCDFYSIPYSDESADAYLSALLAAIEDLGGKGICADTVYFGGGTPNLFGHRRLGAVLDALSSVICISDDAEITMEANPETFCEQSAEDFAAIKINRLSLGLQSSSECELSHLNRLHTPSQVSACVRRANASGINNISLDLMLGLEGQTADSLKSSAHFCAALGVEHVSAYILKIEEGTLFHKNLDHLSLPDEDDVIFLYNTACDTLESHGYRQYEISNFARDGKASRHNLKYWHCEEYLGLGASAHGFYNGTRYFYPRSVRDFIKNPLETVSDGTGGNAEEFFMLTLRLCEGINLGSFQKRFRLSLSDEFYDCAANLGSLGYLKMQSDVLSLTRAGFLVSNTVIAELLSRLS